MRIPRRVGISPISRNDDSQLTCFGHIDRRLETAQPGLSQRTFLFQLTSHHTLLWPTSWPCVPDSRTAALICPTASDARVRSRINRLKSVPAESTPEQRSTQAPRLLLSPPLRHGIITTPVAVLGVAATVAPRRFDKEGDLGSCGLPWKEVLWLSQASGVAASPFTTGKPLPAVLPFLNHPITT